MNFTCPRCKVEYEVGAGLGPVDEVEREEWEQAGECEACWLASVGTCGDCGDARVKLEEHNGCCRACNEGPLFRTAESVNGGYAH